MIGHCCMCCEGGVHIERKANAAPSTADQLLEQLRHCLDPMKRQTPEQTAYAIEQAIAEIERLRGIKPELPPRPPDGDGLPRYGLRWNGPEHPVATPMGDGYWTPWHLAEKASRPSVTLSDFEIQDAHDFLGGEVSGCDYVIEWREAGTVVDDDNKPMRAGYYISLLEYPDEGASLLGPEDVPK